MKVGELLKYGYEILKSKGIESYALDCDLLLGKVIKKDRLFLLLNREYELNNSEIDEFYRLISLRKNKMPIKYMLGECEFMGLSFYVKEGVLIPRPDTETLVECAIEEIKKNNFIHVCDVCCGSGIIGLTIAKLMDNVNIKSSDISDIACEVTKENIKRLNLSEKVEVIKSDLLDKFIKNQDKFDVVVSNPPYIRKEVIGTLMEDVKNFEPYEALCGGDDGLDFYRKITCQSLKVLNKGGVLLFEIGYDQMEDVSNILKEYGFSKIECIKDLAEKDRVIKGKIEIGC
ncbi:peptide chain release factor N(5)-glutamine methyltransferase [Clostridiaceae bacterium UIB06]|uniref:Release factor glutamine methyltransferase n=1 Tax=Clostridium thailandense TaxID=2794346 RepID=A0A949TXL6_9CLOT|nr:peptide chain release factor N(5)-glutamine methyltransferase [Clostridium thailandense]MBV7272354.1 peptide chain release factor N(5)-glutamine methyltransferase [Clostridium thailandense]MCH5135933.1 peptide chain release factor N(5)-glutamine methyltransferase [Clostridiaceae bacterium UIB06]